MIITISLMTLLLRCSDTGMRWAGAREGWVEQTDRHISKQWRLVPMVTQSSQVNEHLRLKMLLLRCSDAAFKVLRHWYEMGRAQGGLG